MGQRFRVGDEVELVVVFVGRRGDGGDRGGCRRDAGPGNRNDHSVIPFFEVDVEFW